MFKFHPFLAVAVAAACAACGASFSAHDSGGSAAGADNAGEANGGLPGSAGSSSVGDAGEADTGGASSAGQGSIAGAGGSVVGSGGASNGGVGGWRSGSGGTWGNADCPTLRDEYTAAVEKARVCDKGSTDQCSASSVAQPLGCGCPVLINAKSEAATAAKKAYQVLQDTHCDYAVGACTTVACLPVASASCAQQAMGPGSTFVCTAVGAIQN